MSEQFPRSREPGSGRLAVTATQRSSDMPDCQPQVPRDTQPVGGGPLPAPVTCPGPVPCLDTRSSSPGAPGSPLRVQEGGAPSLLGREAVSPGPLLLLHVNDLPLSQGANSDACRAVKREVTGEGSRPSARRQGRVASVVTGEPLPGLGASSGFWDHLLTRTRAATASSFSREARNWQTSAASQSQGG